MGLKLTRQSWIPNQHTTIEDSEIPAICYLSEGRKATGEVEFYAVGFTGKKQKPSFNYRFKTDKHRAQYCREWLAGLRVSFDEKMKIKRQEKAPHTLKVGDILSSSWGYNMTNVSWYEVIEVKSTKSVVLQEVGNTVVDTTGYLAGTCKPDTSIKLGNPFMKRATGKNEVKIDTYETAYLWDGKPERFNHCD